MVTYCAFQFPGRTKSAGNGNFATRVIFVTRKQIFKKKVYLAEGFLQENLLLKKNIAIPGCLTPESRACHLVFLLL